MRATYPLLRFYCIWSRYEWRLVLIFSKGGNRQYPLYIHNYWKVLVKCILCLIHILRHPSTNLHFLRWKSATLVIKFHVGRTVGYFKRTVGNFNTLTACIHWTFILIHYAWFPQWESTMQVSILNLKLLETFFIV